MIALTLSPMSAKMLKPHDEEGKGRFERWLDTRFDRLRHGYQRRLHGALDTKGVIGIFGAIVFVSCIFLYMQSPKEPAPAEDQGFIFSFGEADPYTTLDYVERYTEEVTKMTRTVPEVENYFLFNGGFGSGNGSSNTAIAGFVLKPWSERERSTKQVLEQTLQPKISEVTGLNVFAFIPPALPTAGGDGGGEFVIGGIGSLQQLQELADAILAKAYASKRFILPRQRPEDRQASHRTADRPRQGRGAGHRYAHARGGHVGDAVGGYANRFAMQNRSYRVIAQVQRSDRLNPEQLTNYYTRTRTGELVPLSTVVTLKESAQPQLLKRFQQLNAVGISFAPRPGVTKGEALAVLEQAAKEVLPQGYSVDYAGESRQFKQEGTTMLLTLLFALIIIPGAVCAVRELPRCADHVDHCADGDLRRAAGHERAGDRQRHSRTAGHRSLPRHEHQHLYPGRAGDACRRNFQARHPDRGVRQQAAARTGTVEARGDRGSHRDPPAPGVDDHRRPGVRDDPAADGHGPAPRASRWAW